MAVDTTLVSVLRGDGTGSARRDGVALAAASRAEERLFPELVERRARARLVVLAVEVGRRWSPETQKFLSLLARARAEGWLLRRRAEMAWRLRWGSLLAWWRGQWPHRFWNFGGLTPALHEMERDLAGLLR